MPGSGAPAGGRRLIIRPGAIGDFVLGLPAFECLRAEYTEIWAAEQNLPLAHFADRARSIASTGLDLAGLPGVEAPPSLWEALRRFDSIVSWYGTNRPEFREALRPLPVTFHRMLTLEDHGEHAADDYLRQAGCSGPAVPRLNCPKEPGGFAVIHPFSSAQRKNWPLEKYRELARRIERSMPVHWCAGPEEPLEGAVRMSNLYDLACWFARAAVFIGNDTGTTHLAAAAGAPVVALFGPTDPAVWAPRGPRVAVLHAPAIESLPTDAVMDAVRAVCGD